MRLCCSISAVLALSLFAGCPSNLPASSDSGCPDCDARVTTDAAVADDVGPVLDAAVSRDARVATDGATTADVTPPRDAGVRADAGSDAATPPDLDAGDPGEAGRDAGAADVRDAASSGGADAAQDAASSSGGDAAQDAGAQCPEAGFCDDGDPCTRDSCDGAGGCAHVLDLALCPAPTLSIGDSVAKRGGALLFDLTLSGPAPEALVLELAAVGITATAVEDFASGTYRYTVDDRGSWQAAEGTAGTRVRFPYRGERLTVEIMSQRRPQLGFPLVEGPRTYGEETLTLQVASLVSGLAADVGDTGTGTLREWICFGADSSGSPDRCDHRGRYLSVAHREDGCLRYGPRPSSGGGGPVDPELCSYCDDTSGSPEMRAMDLCSLEETGQQRCRDDALETCTLIAGCGYVWKLVEDCSDGGGRCEAAHCVDSVCTSTCPEVGEVRCTDAAPEVCMLSHPGCDSWNLWAGMCMQADWYCLDLAGEMVVGQAEPCDIVTEGQLSCQHDIVYQCVLVHDRAYMGCGYRWRPACVDAAPGDPGCPAAACNTGAGDHQRCQDGALELCTVDACGSYWRPDESCAACNALCSEPEPDSYQCLPQSCDVGSLGARRCVGDRIEACMDSLGCGAHWRPVDDCSRISEHTCYPDASHDPSCQDSGPHCDYR
ncbi:MAG: hypothetical protein ABIJ09_23290 [Pseudomonadota bacterium]